MNVSAAAQWGGSVVALLNPESIAIKTGSFAPKPQGGDMRSRRVEQRRAGTLAALEAQKDISLEELCQALIEVGLHVSLSGLHHFFVRHGMTRKKRLATRSRGTVPPAA